MKRSFLLCITLSVLTAACSKESSPTAPTPPAATHIIRLGGNLNFGGVQVGTVLDGVLTVSNDGNDLIQLTGMALDTNEPSFRVTCMGRLVPLSPTRFTLAPGETLPVGFRFEPVTTLNCSGSLRVEGNQTSGANTIAVTAFGVAPPR